MLEDKFIVVLNKSLRTFKKSGNGYRFSCPYCGDSATNSTKARGNVYVAYGVYKYRCFNCDKRTSFNFFLEFMDIRLYNNYIVQKYYASNNVLYKNKVEELLLCKIKKTNKEDL